MIKKRVLGLAAMSCLMVSGTLVAAEPGIRKKGILASGWDLLHVTTADVHRNRAKFAATGVDGAIIRLFGRKNGKSYDGSYPIVEQEWTDEEFAETRRLLSEITTCEGLRESFAMQLWTPGKRIAWTDDAAWKRLAANVAVLARTARAGGLKGFVIDHEDYSHSGQFAWRSGDPGQKDLLPLVRRRGKEVFGALYKAFPDAYVMAYYLFSEPRDAVSTVYPMAVDLARGDLWTTFLNGLLDVAPRGAHILDGCENYCYGANAEMDEFRIKAERVRHDHAQLVSPSNRAKYAETLSVAFGQYLDIYAQAKEGKGKPWFQPLDGSPVKRFAIHFAGAMHVSDEYVWVYGEKGSWIDWDEKRGDAALSSPTWETQLPGLADMFRAAKGEPVSVRICDEGLENRAWNSDCDPVPGQDLPFGTWTDQKGVPNPFAYEPKLGASKPGCLKLTGYGLFACDAAGLKPGERIVIKVKARGPSAAVCVIWSSKGERQWGVPYVNIGPLSKMDDDHWTELSAVAEVPDIAGAGLPPIDGVNIQLQGPYATPEHPVYYDDICVLKHPSGAAR